MQPFCLYSKRAHVVNLLRVSLGACESCTNLSVLTYCCIISFVFSACLINTAAAAASAPHISDAPFYDTVPKQLPGFDLGIQCANTSFDNQRLNLSCWWLPGLDVVINSVDFASYGTPAGACPNFSNGSCDANTSVSVVQAKCVGKHSCTINGSSEVFGDPCPQTPKHLAVKVSCIFSLKNSNDTVCGFADDGTALTLGCAAGKRITKIDFASYGTPQGTCNNPVAGSCSASTSQTVVESACLNKNRCFVSASNKAFGDPCPHTHKQLAALVTCTSAIE